MKEFADYKSVEEIDARVAEIDAELKTDNANVEELGAEFEGLKARRAELANEADKAILRAAIEGEGQSVADFTPNTEDKHMNMTELRASKSYVEAFANGLKEVYRNGKSDFAECRAAITTELASNGTADIPVPSIVDEIIGTAWEKDGITARVKKSYIKGVVRIGVEIEADDAVVHAEGAAAPNAENLVIAVVSLSPETIKKWVQVSDEVLDLDGEAFLRYIYDELTYRVAKKAADRLLGKITAAGTVSTNTPTTNIAVAAISTASITVGLIAEALGKLNDEASAPVVIMNKSTWAAFKAVQYAGGFNVDPFEGLEVVFNNSLASFADATTGVPFAIVGDLGYGAQMNFPNGDDVKIKYDDLDDAEADLVKIIGRLPVGSGVIRENAFCQIKKA
jgi:HK97 family phage major capsid protein